jgi:hypothetical protein
LVGSEEKNGEWEIWMDKVFVCRCFGFCRKKKGWLQLVGYEIEERETTRMEAKRSRFTGVQLKKGGSWLFR